MNTHQEAKSSRREFMLLPAKLVESGRKKRIDIAIVEKKWNRIKSGYERLIKWMNSNAPQLNLSSTIANIAIAFQDQFSPKILLN